MPKDKRGCNEKSLMICSIAMIEHEVKKKVDLL